MLHVTLLGRFSARHGARTVPLRDGSKAQELLAYLLLNRRQAHTREALASLLWSRCSTSRSKAYLRKVLWQLQTALGSARAEGAGRRPLLLLDGEWLRVNAEVEVWLDVAVFEAAYSETRGRRGLDLDREAAEALARAVALYRGDLLPNRYEEWCLVERERLKHLYLCMLEKLMDFSEAHDGYEAGILYGIEILQHESTHERTHQAIMRLHAGRGDRSGALRQYRQCAELLQRELGIEPMEETTRLCREIRDGVVPAAAPPAAAARDAPSVDALRQLVVRLDQLHEELAEIRRRAEAAIHTLDPATEAGTEKATSLR